MAKNTVPTSNPVGRLYHLLHGVRTTGWPGSRLALFRRTFGVEFDRQLVVELANVDRLIADAAAMIRARHPDHPQYEEWIGPVEHLFSLDNLHSNVRDGVTQSLTDRIMTILELEAIAIGRQGYADTLDNLDDLLSLINDTERDVLKMEVNKTLRDVLLDSLSLMRDAILSYHRYGPRALKQALKIATMDVAEVVHSQGETAKTATVSVGFWTVIDRARSVVQVATGVCDLVLTALSLKQLPDK